MTEEEFTERLAEFLHLAEDEYEDVDFFLNGATCRSFQQDGVLTGNNGFTIKLPKVSTMKKRMVN